MFKRGHLGPWRLVVGVSQRPSARPSTGRLSRSIYGSKLSQEKLRGLPSTFKKMGWTRIAALNGDHWITTGNHGMAKATSIHSFSPRQDYRGPSDKAKRSMMKAVSRKAFGKDPAADKMMRTFEELPGMVPLRIAPSAVGFDLSRKTSYGYGLVTPKTRRANPRVVRTTAVHIRRRPRGRLRRRS